MGKSLSLPLPLTISPFAEWPCGGRVLAVAGLSEKSVWRRGPSVDALGPGAHSLQLAHAHSGAYMDSLSLSIYLSLPLSLPLSLFLSLSFFFSLSLWCVLSWAWVQFGSSNTCCPEGSKWTTYACILVGSIHSFSSRIGLTVPLWCLRLLSVSVVSSLCSLFSSCRPSSTFSHSSWVSSHPTTDRW